MKKRFTGAFALAVLAASSPALAATFVHRPYLQMGKPDGGSVCWRIDAAASLTVRYGTDSTNLNQTSPASANTANACVALTGLAPATRYYYQVYDGATLLPGQQSPSRQFLKTSPTVGSKGKYTFWFAGDFGVGPTYAATRSGWPALHTAALRVRDAFMNVNGSAHVDGLLFLGDIAYYNGEVRELTEGTFDIMYEPMATSVTWPAMGNHDTYTDQASAYRTAFELPAAAQAGGAASNSEYYYSFDYGNIHFIVLEFTTSARTITGPQYLWLQQDLQTSSARNADWIVVYAHHNPYTRGTHNSETESDLVQLRYNYLPLLEQYGVDFFFMGHSHNYERSYLIDSAYGANGTSTTQATHDAWYTTNRARIIKDSSSGDPEGTGPYRKAKGGNKGAVYVVVGSSGQMGSSGSPGSSSNKHPLMRVQQWRHGSVIFEVSDSVATGWFIDTARVVRDRFQLVKSPQVTPVRTLQGPGQAAAPFSQSGRSLRFDAGNVVPFQVYSLDGRLMFRGVPAGTWEVGRDVLPAGVYRFRHGARFGKLVLP